MLTLLPVSFLRALAANNNRDGFNENKPVYELDIRQPADATFQAYFNLSGEALKRALYGYSPDFIDTVCQRFHAADSYMRFLCKAIEVRM